MRLAVFKGHHLRENFVLKPHIAEWVFTLFLANVLEVSAVEFTQTA